MVSMSSGRGTFFVFIMFLFELLISTSNSSLKCLLICLKLGVESLLVGIVERSSHEFQI